MRANGTSFNCSCECVETEAGLALGIVLRLLAGHVSHYNDQLHKAA